MAAAATQRPISASGPRTLASSGAGAAGVKVALANPVHGGKNLPIDASFIPKPATSHSDWIHQNRESLLVGENPEQSPALYNQDKNIFWPAFVDYAQKNPVVLQTAIFRRVHDPTAWIFGFFPIVISMAATYTMSSIKITPMTPQIGVRKVPGREIPYQVSQTTQGTAYTGQGFAADYHHMKTDEGMAYWDSAVNQLTSNLWAIMIYMAMMQLHMTASPYSATDKQYPYTGRPETPAQVFAAERITFGIFNKDPQAVHTLSAYVSQIFSQNNLPLTAWLASRGDIYFANMMDESQTAYDKSGAQALRNRNSGDTYTSMPVGEVGIYSVPFLGEAAQGGPEHDLLEADRSTGSHFSFFDNTLALPKGRYTSDMRSIKVCDWTTNGKTTYRLDDFLAHVPEFYPLDDACRKGRQEEDDDDMDGGQKPLAKQYPGRINRRLLHALAHAAQDEPGNANPYILCQTQKEGNERSLNVLLKYEYDNYTQDQINRGLNWWHPIELVGELDPEMCKTHHLQRSVYKTMEFALQKNLSADERTILQRGIDLADSMNRSNPGKGLFKAIGGIVGNLRTQATPFGCSMAIPNKFGGLNLSGMTAAEAEAFGNVKEFWTGFGDISGMMTLRELFMTHPTLATKAPDVSATVIDFVPVFEKLVSNMLSVSGRDHVALSPDMVPLHHFSTEMTDLTKAMIVAWYTLVSSFNPPCVLRRSNPGPPSGAATSARMTQKEQEAAIKIREGQEADARETIAGAYSDDDRKILREFYDAHGLPAGSKIVPSLLTFIDETGFKDAYNLVAAAAVATDESSNALIATIQARLDTFVGGPVSVDALLQITQNYDLFVRFSSVSCAIEQAQGKFDDVMMAVEKGIDTRDPGQSRVPGDLIIQLQYHPLPAKADKQAVGTPRARARGKGLHKRDSRLGGGGGGGGKRQKREQQGERQLQEGEEELEEEPEEKENYPEDYPAEVTTWGQFLDNHSAYAAKYETVVISKNRAIAREVIARVAKLLDAGIQLKTPSSLSGADDALVNEANDKEIDIMHSVDEIFTSETNKYAVEKVLSNIVAMKRGVDAISLSPEGDDEESVGFKRRLLAAIGVASDQAQGLITEDILPLVRTETQTIAALLAALIEGMNTVAKSVAAVEDAKKRTALENYLREDKERIDYVRNTMKDLQTSIEKATQYANPAAKRNNLRKAVGKIRKAMAYIVLLKLECTVTAVHQKLIKKETGSRGSAVDYVVGTVKRVYGALRDATQSMFGGAEDDASELPPGIDRDGAQAEILRDTADEIEVFFDDDDPQADVEEGMLLAQDLREDADERTDTGLRRIDLAVEAGISAAKTPQRAQEVAAAGAKIVRHLEMQEDLWNIFGDHSNAAGNNLSNAFYGQDALSRPLPNKSVIGMPEDLNGIMTDLIRKISQPKRGVTIDSVKVTPRSDSTKGLLLLALLRAGYHYFRREREAFTNLKGLPDVPKAARTFIGDVAAFLRTVIQYEEANQVMAGLVNGIAAIPKFGELQPEHLEDVGRDKEQTWAVRKILGLLSLVLVEIGTAAHFLDNYQNYGMQTKPKFANIFGNEPNVPRLVHRLVTGPFEKAGGALLAGIGLAPGSYPAYELGDWAGKYLPLDAGRIWKLTDNGFPGIDEWEQAQWGPLGMGRDPIAAERRFVGSGFRNWIEVAGQNTEDSHDSPNRSLQQGFVADPYAAPHAVPYTDHHRRVDMDDLEAALDTRVSVTIPVDLRDMINGPARDFINGMRHAAVMVTMQDSYNRLHKRYDAELRSGKGAITAFVVDAAKTFTTDIVVKRLSATVGYLEKSAPVGFSRETWDRAQETIRDLASRGAGFVGEFDLQAVLDVTKMLRARSPTEAPKREEIIMGLADQMTAIAQGVGVLVLSHVLVWQHHDIQMQSWDMLRDAFTGRRMASQRRLPISGNMGARMMRTNGPAGEAIAKMAEAGENDMKHVLGETKDAEKIAHDIMGNIAGKTVGDFLYEKDSASYLGNMRPLSLVQVEDRLNPITGSGYTYMPGNACVDAFGVTERGSIGGTLLTALPYVNPMYVMGNRSNASSSAAPLYRNGMPNSTTQLDVQAQISSSMLEAHLYNEDAYELARKAFPDLPAAAVHGMIYPLAGNPENPGHCSDLERRFVEAGRLPLMARLAARLALLTVISLDTMLRWYDNNIAIPFGGLILRPWEQQTMFSQIAVAGDRLGTFFFSGFDNTVSFDQMFQHFSFQTFFHAGAVIEDTQRFVFAKDTRGGAPKGGKGNRYVNSSGTGVIPLFQPDFEESREYREKANDLLSHKVYHGELLGNHSNIAVLQGYNTVVDKTTPSHFDIMGNWNEVDFAGRLDNSMEFQATRRETMYDGQYMVNMIWPLRRAQSQYVTKSMSHAQRTEVTAHNNHVHQTTQWMYDEIANETEKKSFHPWGDQYEGLLDRETSRMRVPVASAAVIAY